MKLIGYDSDSVNWNPLPKRKKTNKDRLRKIYSRDLGVCHLCRMYCLFEDASIEHVIPRSKGGSSRLSNVKLAHKACNFIKGDSTVWQSPEYYIRHKDYHKEIPATIVKITGKTVRLSGSKYPIPVIALEDSK